ncbi:MAG: prenyltransferase [Glaciecola sp.]
MKHLPTVIQSARPPFLLLALVCVFLGIATANTANSINAWHAILAALGAVLAHVSVNAFNEYFDYKSGLDHITEKNPFSGGSGGLVANPHALSWVLITAITSLALCIFIGTYFWLTVGPAIIPIGITGIVVILLYTSVFNKYPWVCWVSPGIGFGWLITLGTNVVLGGHISEFAFLVSCLPLLLCNNLLLLNQFPDIKADQTIGRKTLPIAKGTQFSLHLFGLTLIATCGLIVYIYTNFHLHPFILTTYLPVFVGLGIYKKLFEAQKDNAKLIPLMGGNVAITLITPVLFSIGILLS